MLQSIINITEIENFKDFSPEFYKPAFIKLSKILRSLPYKKVGNIAYVTDGEHGSPMWDESSGIKYITAEFIKPNFIEEGITKSISIIQDERNARARVQENDVLVYSVGAYAGYAAKAESHLFPANIPRSVAIIRLHNTNVILPEFLSVFLNSKFGIFQSLRYRAGNSQPVLALEKIKQFEVPEVKMDIQKQIAKLYNDSYALRRKYVNLINTTSEYFVKLFELDSIPLKSNKVFNGSFINVVLNNRFDSGFFNPKYSIIYNKITEICKTNNWEIKKLGLIASNFKYGSSDKLNYTKEGTPFLRIADLQEKRFEKENLKFISDIDANKLNHAKVFAGDVLISRSGSLGITVPIHKDLDGSVFGSYFIKFHPHEYIDIEYLSFYLNSIIGSYQIEQVNSGGIQTNITIPMLKSLYIVLPTKEIQEEITSKLKQAFNNKYESKRYLEIASSLLEKSIYSENNE